MLLRIGDSVNTSDHDQGQLTRDSFIPFILDLFARRGAEEYLGEAVSMSEHMEQSAACARADQASDATVIAALLHDIGHFVGDFPLDAHEYGIDNLHEDAGATFLAPWFPPEVTEPIRLHVAAKKYLCAVDPGYHSLLSQASIHSLELQGGPMTTDEVRQFESNPWHREAVQLRHYDDDGKVAGLNIVPVTDYRETLEALLK